MLGGTHTSLSCGDGWERDGMPGPRCCMCLSCWSIENLWGHGGEGVVRVRLRGPFSFKISHKQKIETPVRTGRTFLCIDPFLYLCGSIFILLLVTKILQLELNISRRSLHWFHCSRYLSTSIISFHCLSYFIWLDISLSWYSTYRPNNLKYWTPNWKEVIVDEKSILVMFQISQIVICTQISNVVIIHFSVLINLYRPKSLQVKVRILKDFFEVLLANSCKVCKNKGG